MFGFWKKKKDDLSIDEIEKETENYLEKIKKSLQTDAKEETVAEGFRQQGLRLKKQENMLEEILELTDESGEALEKLDSRIAALEESLQKEKQEQRQEQQRQEQQRQEQKLIAIIIKYDEYLTQSQEMQSEMKEQQELIKKSLDKYLMTGQLGRIAGTHQQVDLNQMQVLQIEETMDRTLDNRVKETVIPGWIYKGEILQKAKVIVWKYKGSENGQNHRN